MVEQNEMMRRVDDTMNENVMCDVVMQVCGEGSLLEVFTLILKSCRHLRILLTSRDLNDGPRRALAENFNQGSSEDPH